MSGKTRRLPYDLQTTVAREVEMTLVRAWQEDGDAQARGRLLASYEPLVWKWANRMGKIGGFEVEDLVQEGRIALARALDDFDTSTGNRYGTLANVYVHHALLRFVMDFAGPVRQATNPNDRRLFVHLRRECRAWETREGRELDRTGILEIATKLKVPVGHLERQLDRMTRADLAIDQSPAVAEMLPVDSAEEAVTTARSRAKAVAIIETALASLSERDRRVFELRFVAEHTPTRLEIGDRLGISKERVRQLEERALKAVRGALAAAGIHDLAAVA